MIRPPSARFEQPGHGREAGAEDQRGGPPECHDIEEQDAHLGQGEGGEGVGGTLAKRCLHAKHALAKQRATGQWPPPGHAPAAAQTAG